MSFIFSYNMLCYISQPAIISYNITYYKFHTDIHILRQRFCKSGRQGTTAYFEALLLPCPIPDSVSNMQGRPLQVLVRLEAALSGSAGR